MDISERPESANGCQIVTHPVLQMYNVFPRLMEWLPGRHHEMFGKIEKVRAFTMEKIKEHEDTLDPSSPRDYIDCFLMRLDQVQQKLQIDLIISGYLRRVACSALAFLSVPLGKTSTKHRVPL